MVIKRLEKSDIPELIKIHDKFYSFPFPDLDNPLCAIQRVVSSGNEIVLAAIVRLTSEIIFITNKDLPNVTRVKAIKLANDKMYQDAINFGIEDFHAFAEEEDNFPQILRKLGWQDCKGFPMVRLK